MLYVIYKLTKSHVASIVATTFYIFNPVVVERMQHILLLLSYALLPLFFYLTFKIFHDISREKKIKLRSIIFIPILWTLMSTSPHWIVFCVGIIFYIFIMILILLLKRIKIRKYVIKSVTVFSPIAIIYAGLSSFWLIPYIFQISSKFIQPPYTFTEEVVALLSRNAHLMNAIRLDNHWWPGGLFSPPIPMILCDVITFAVPILACLSLLLASKKNKPIILLTLILAVILIFLSKGVNTPMGWVYTTLCFKIPLISSVGWLFRDPHKWTFLLSFCYSLLIGFLILEVYNRFNIKNTLMVKNKKTFHNICVTFCLVTLLLIIPVINGYPLLTGDLNGKLKPQAVPDEYIQLDQWLGEQDTTFKIAMYPCPPPWGIIKPTIRYDLYWRFSVDSLLNNRTNKFGMLLNIWSVKYIIVRTQPSKSETESNYLLTLFKKSEDFIDSIKYQDNIKFIDKFGTLYVFENLNYSSSISTSTNNLAILGDRSALNSLAKMDLLDKNLASIYFLSQNIETLSNFTIFDEMILKENILYQSIMQSRSSKIIKPFDATIHHDPSKMWSKASTDDPLNGPWHPYLEKRDIENWDFDYAAGLVFTWAPSVLKESYLLKKEDSLATYDFEDNITNWSINTPNIQKMFLANISHHGDHSVAIKLNESALGWKTISSPLLPITHGSQYKWEFYVKGKDVYEVHTKVIEYNETEELLESHYIIGIGSGDFDWEKVTFNFIPSSPDTKYMQLQLWHGHETNQTLPNRIWIDDVRIYNLSEYLKPNSLEIPFNVEKDGNYELFIRYFKNQDGGKIGLHLDGEILDIIETENQLNKFTWKHLKTLCLKQGCHTLTLENIGGFNAVNIFALIPANEYKNIEMETYDLLKGKRVIYLFEAETDLYRKNTEVLNVGGKASNGELLQLQADSKIWGDIEIQRDGNHTVALRLNGSALIKIDNQTFTVNSTYLDFVYFNLHLMQGRHRIELLSEQHQPIIWTFDKTEKDFEEWKENTPESLIYGLSPDMENGKNCLKAELNNSTWGWKTINSPLIPISSNKEYLWGFEIKGENVHSVHAKIAEYNKSKNIIQTTRLGSIGDGTFDWTNVTFYFKPTSANTSYMQLQIWHGHNTPQPLPNTIWLDNVRTYGHSPSQIDVLWIYSAKENETIDDIFSPKENPAKIITYEKIDPTKYIITINSTSPFMLSFAELYDPLWAAYVDGTEYQPVPLYSVINGFWINKTGDLEIVIKYKPQDWFETGSLISITTLIGCMGYLLYDWKKNDKRIIMVKKKIHNILKKGK